MAIDLNTKMELNQVLGQLYAAVKAGGLNVMVSVARLASERGSKVESMNSSQHIILVY